ncbi:unnamed protein product, partial [Rotaria magnacalcarata]
FVQRHMTGNSEEENKSETSNQRTVLLDIPPRLQWEKRSRLLW